MHVRVRLACLLVVLFAALIARAQQPGPMFAFGSTAKGFPDEVTVSASPVPNIYGDKPELRVLQLLSSMNAMWAQAFDQAGDGYGRPRVEARTARADSGCGADREEWAGIYCAAGKQIVIDIGDQLVIRAAAGDDLADDLLGYVLAHEVGHHVQALRGMARTTTQREVLRAELHAQCLAGVWGRAAGRALPPTWTYGVDADHGTIAQQQLWLERGHSRGRPADCDSVWD